ncbi:MAG: hypothetical protein KDD06_16210, partial [Phaeodactylibacter sp.]|nr:hypothetical protein [Phaeodactylibacter sp.]
MKCTPWLLLAMFFLPAVQVGAQKPDSTLKYFWITFTDKADSPYSIENPDAFLSNRAIARRQKRNIPVTEEDFPPNPAYLDSLRSRGAFIHHRSRWLNAATALVSEDSVPVIAGLPFVDKVEYVGFPYEERSRRKTAIKADSLLTPPLDSQYYGYASRQIQWLNGDTLHQLGYMGTGIWLAVLDGGFIGVEESPFFDSLRAQGRLLLARDFVDGDMEAYESSTHGTRVLSTMGANVPG